MGETYDPFDDDYFDDDGEGPPCPRCSGDGTVNCYCGPSKDHCHRFTAPASKVWQRFGEPVTEKQDG